MTNSPIKGRARTKGRVQCAPRPVGAVRAILGHRDRAEMVKPRGPGSGPGRLGVCCPQRAHPQRLAQDFSAKNLWGAACPPRPLASPPSGYFATDEVGAW